METMESFARHLNECVEGNTDGPLERENEPALLKDNSNSPSIWAWDCGLQ